MSEPTVTEKDIAQVCDGLLSSAREELRRMTGEDLEKYWFFEWSDHVSLEANIYSFHKMLDLYGGQCRRWEEMHNGYVCVVERVRDKYLTPKIREFAAKVRGCIH
ncbi:MAG: hypothetical protein ACRCWJ_14930, partial [Casimicrobium sp.]